MSVPGEVCGVLSHDFHSGLWNVPFFILFQSLRAFVCLGILFQCDWFSFFIRNSKLILLLMNQIYSFFTYQCYRVNSVTYNVGMVILKSDSDFSGFFDAVGYNFMFIKGLWFSEHL